MTTIDGTDYVMLESLPEDDPLRTSLLQDIGAEYCFVKDPLTWRKPTQEKFWGFTYNDLNGPWITFNKWRAPRPASKGND